MASFAKTHILLIITLLISVSSAFKLTFFNNKPDSETSSLLEQLSKNNKPAQNINLQDAINKFQNAKKNFVDNREQIIEENIKTHLKGDNFIETMANMGAAMVIKSEIETMAKNIEEQKDDPVEFLSEENKKSRQRSRWTILCNVAVIGENKFKGDGKVLKACEKLKENANLENIE